MTAPIVIHGFATSNNFKVLVSLAYKGLEHEFRRIDPADPASREALRGLSGQELTPVLQHGDAVLFDSAAIMRYLDANFRDTPSLYGRTRGETWPIERWERLARGPLAAPMMEIVTITIVRGEEVSPEQVSDAGVRFEAVGRELVDGLGDREWLVGDAMTAADIAPACVLHRIRVSDMLPWPVSLAPLEPWIARVVAYLPEDLRA